MKLFDYINKKEYELMLKNGYIFEQQHTLFKDIYLISYSKICQMQKIWNDTTMKCRGIVYNKTTEEILAIPFKKFFNYEEFPEEEIDEKIDSLIKDNHKYKIYNKLDGSLGILYWVDDVPFICTKGSFNSEQAFHANYILTTKYGSIFSKLDRDITYLFEIIYPTDLHVVSYGGVDDIFLIGAINRQTCEDIDIESIPYFRQTHWFDDISDWRNIRNIINGDNKEGFVIRFDNGFRFKLKYERYWELHYLKTGLTRKKILNALIEDKMDVIKYAISRFDEEHQIYYNRIVSDITDRYNEIYNICKAEFEEFDDIKEGAEYYKTCTYPSIMFSMRNGRYDMVRKYIYKLIKNSEKITDDEDDE